MMNGKSLAFGCVGLGGYAKMAINAILAEQDHSGELPAVAKLVAVCDHDLSPHAELIEQLKYRGVRIYQGLESLLADTRCQAVWLPVPIALHRSFTEQALVAGKAVLCEKPAAGCIDDVDAMIAARDRSALPVAIGFQSIYQPDVQAVKQYLLDGALGTLQSATVVGCWPRDAHYYSRNTWAGAVRRSDRWILDSPANNAASHMIHQALFWLGDTPIQAARPTAIEAELYRANTIENYDTCAMRVTIGGDMILNIYMTHACPVNRSFIRMTGTKGTLFCDWGRSTELRTAAGVTRFVQDTRSSAHVMLQHFARWVHGDSRQTVATLESARMHSLIISGASDATRVYSIPADNLRVSTTLQGASRREICGIIDLCLQCAERGVLFHESGLVPWSQSAGKISFDSYAYFSGNLLIHD